MEIKGKVIAILPEITGTGKNGAWKSQDFVIETADQYPKKVCLKCFNKHTPKMDEVVNVFFDTESREYNGKWFTNLNVWKFEVEVQTAQPQSEQSPTQSTQTPPEGDGLPF